MHLFYLQYLILTEVVLKKIDITPEELEQARAILEREKAENIRLQIEANEIMKGFKD